MARGNPVVSKEKGCTKMNIPNIGFLVLTLLVILEALAIYFLIYRVKDLEENEQQGTSKLNYLAEKQVEIEETHTLTTESIGKLRKNLTALQKKVKAILDEE